MSSSGLTTLPVVFDIFSPPTIKNPPTAQPLGGSMPADMSIAGQYTQWNRMMSLPMKCQSTGQRSANCWSSVP